MPSLTHLFSPSSIGSMALKNRIVMSPMHTDYGNDDGTVSERLRDYHVARARGGVGLMVSGGVWWSGQQPSTNSRSL